MGKRGSAQELGELCWYFLPDGSTEVLTTVDQINAFIACDKGTPRSLCPSVSRDTIRLVMNRWRQQGKLEMLGKGRDAKWQRIKEK